MLMICGCNVFLLTASVEEFSLVSESASSSTLDEPENTQDDTETTVPTCTG